jgi:hypothetical protein
MGIRATLVGMVLSVACASTETPPAYAPVCAPQCGGRECGPDPFCGSSCGLCTAPRSCDRPSGLCDGNCQPTCGERRCGLDPVCGSSCGTCPTGQTCGTDGTCGAPCTPNCAGRTCGEDPVCGKSCGSCATGFCDDGVCDASCTPDCTGRTCGEDPACGQACGTCSGIGVVCVDGACEQGECPPGTLACASGCAAYLEDEANCGACGHVCPSKATATRECRLGGCHLSCPGGTGADVDLDNDANNCGRCGNSCPTPIEGTRRCVAGVCNGLCPAGNTACGGTCIDTRTDPHHCGYCDHGCPAPTGGAPECVNGLCTTGLCYAGELVCSSACVEESVSRCGGCSATCNGFASQTGVALADIACSDGACITRLNSRTRQSCAQLCQSLGLTCTSPSQALTLDWWSDGCVSPGNGGCTLSWQGGYRYDTPGCVNYFASLGGGSITCTAVVYDCDTVPSTSYYWSSVNGSFTSMNCYCGQ